MMVASISSIFDQYNSTEQVVTNRIVQNNRKESSAMSKFSLFSCDSFLATWTILKKKTHCNKISGINFQARLGCRGERVQGF